MISYQWVRKYRSQTDSKLTLPSEARDEGGSFYGAHMHI